MVNYFREIIILNSVNRQSRNDEDTRQTAGIFTFATITERKTATMVTANDKVI